MIKKIVIIMTTLMVVTVFALNYQSDLIFSHKYHVGEMETECSACHVDVMKSEVGTDDLLVAMETCYQCHSEDDTECSYCHEKGDEPVLLPRIDTYSAKFSHKQHAQGENSCMTCHDGVSEKEKVNSGLHLPMMADCMSCHEPSQDMNDCYVCHTENENLKPGNHNLLWTKSHGVFTSQGNDECSMCHGDDSCVECHNGLNIDGKPHNDSFMLTHHISYDSYELDCFSCHEGYSDCITCHRDINNVVPVNHKFQNWTKGANLHADEGRTNIDNCAVCHYESGDAACITCHSNW